MDRLDINLTIYRNGVMVDKAENKPKNESASKKSKAKKVESIITSSGAVVIDHNELRARTLRPRWSNSV